MRSNSLIFDIASEHATTVASLNQRKAQMLPLIEFRPHWLRRGPCSGGQQITSAAGDVPCPCEHADFSCRLYALTPRELSQLDKA